MARKPVKLPDYFTAEEARALVAEAPSYQVRMAMRVMLRTGLRVSETLSLRPADLRLNQDPPIISLRPEVTGKRARRAARPPSPTTWWSTWRTWPRAAPRTGIGRSLT